MENVISNGRRVAVRGAGFLFLCLAVSACSDKASHNTVETARGIASENAIFSAQKYRSSAHADWAIVPRGDSTQSRECPQGDGWASIDLMSPDRTRTLKLKCSTYSAGIGCLTAEDFNSRANLAGSENKCSGEVPFPIPKIAQ